MRGSGQILCLTKKKTHHFGLGDNKHTFIGMCTCSISENYGEKTRKNYVPENYV